MLDPSTPAGFRAARNALGLSAEGMAKTLQVSSGRTIRRWEKGDRDIPGPAAVAVRMMLDKLAASITDNLIADLRDAGFAVVPKDVKSH